MRRFAYFALFGLALATTSACHAAEPPAPEPPPVLATPKPLSAAEIDALIKQLGDDDMATREGAEEALQKAGFDALPAVEAASKGDDPEVRLRAERVAGKLRVNVVLAKLDAAQPDLQNVEYDLTMESTAKETNYKCLAHIKMLANENKYSMDFEIKAEGFEMKGRAVGDGEWMWNEMEIEKGHKSVSKSRQTKIMRANAGMFSPFYQPKQMREAYTFLDVRESKLDGAEVYVLHAEFKDKKDAERAAAKAGRLFYVDKSNLSLKCIEDLNAQGEKSMRYTPSAVKIGVQFDPTIFKYAPPEGAEVKEQPESEP